MKRIGLSNPLSSFRAQMVSFIVVMLALTVVVYYILTRQSEKRNTDEFGEYIRAITLATDTVYRSLAEGKYLWELANQPDKSDSLTVNDQSVIRHILVVDAANKIYDSTNEKDIGQSFKRIAEDAPPFSIGDLKDDSDDIGDNQSRSIHYFITTSTKNPSTGEQESTRRDIYIIFSLTRFTQAREMGDRIRLIVFVPLALVLIAAIAVFSKRLTRPISELSQAARKVTKGDLDFNVSASGPNEVTTLSKTFNEMLVGLRSKRDLEEQLQRAERSAVVGRLASGIAHEIRNPLNFINLSIDHLRAAFAPKEEPGRAQYTHILTTIKDELGRLNRLVSDFLSYGRPAKLKIKEFDARTLIEEVRDLVNTQAEQQGVKININQNGARDTKLYGDTEQIKTCFSNLMINAIQAMPDGGALNVSMRPENSHLEIKFADTGSGITSEAMGQIFEPYFSTKETGIGLGLPLTKKIIEEHGGQIEVESEPDRGTTFTVTLLCKPRMPY
jgi:signal transduction histidine kinase